MDKRFLLFSGIFIFFIGVVLLLNSLLGMTGFIIFENISADFRRIFGSVFVILGLIIFLSGLENRVEKTKRQLKEILESRKIGNYDELRRIAERMGYVIKEGGNHSKVYMDGKFITTIPRHAGGVATGTYRGIVKELYSNAA